MRLNLVLDSAYLLSSLWGPGNGPQACLSNPLHQPEGSYETVRPPRREVPAEVVAFVNVNVVPMDAERVLPNQTVVIEGKHIIALGPAAKIAIPMGARRIDGRGKYLMPGLGDTHIHVGLPLQDNLSGQELANRVVRQITDGVAILLYRGSPNRQMLLEAEAFGSPHIYTGTHRFHRNAFFESSPEQWAKGGPQEKAIGARLAIPKLAEKKDRPANDVITRAAQAQADGFRYFNISTRMVAHAATNPLVDSILAAAHQFGFAIGDDDHDKSFGQVTTPTAANRSIDHLMWITDTLIQTFVALDASDSLIGRHAPVPDQYYPPIEPVELERALAAIPALAAATARAGLWATPTLSCTIMTFNLSPSYTRLLQQVVKGLQDAGVRLLTGSDDGLSLHDELMHLVQAGLTPYQALRASTYNVADFLGLLDSAGTVAAGKRADLVLLYGNPLENIHYAREPAGVMMHGQWLDRDELDRRLLAIQPRGPLEFDFLGSWFRLGLIGGAIVSARHPSIHQPPADTTPAGLQARRERRNEQFLEFRARMKRFEAFADSLAAARTQGAAGASAAQRLRHRMAAELGEMRAMLPPEKHGAFDPVARLWLREQARQGHWMKISGVTLTQ